MKTGNSPSYLIKNHYAYCFRIRIPKDLFNTANRKELRYSLGTGTLSDAKAKARYLAGQFQLLFRDIRLSKMNLTKEQIHKLIKKHKDRLFVHYDEPVMYGQFDGVLDPEAETGLQHQWLEHSRKQFQHKLIAGDYSEIEKTADKILVNNGLSSADIDKTSSEYSKLCHGLLRAELKGLDRYEKNLNVEFADDLEEIFNDSIAKPSIQTGTLAPFPTPADTTPEPVDHGPLLSEFMEKFPDTKPRWDIATHRAYQTAMKVALKILGDIHIGLITRAIMVGYRETLLKSPAYWTNRHTQIRVEDLPAPGLPTIGKSTFDRNLTFISQLMDYAADKSYLKDSPMPKSRMSLPDDNIEVQGLNDDQVKTILAATCDFDDHRYWLPLLGLYTGGRANELCQLHKDDLKEQEGVWYLDINTDGKKTLKNKASNRLVPLHSVIIELGFIEYVKTVNHHRIFPGCKYRESTGKYANNFGQWFNRLLVDTGVKEKGDRSVTFHSFRHRAYTILKRLGIDNEHIDRIIGHNLSETKNKTYHHGYELQTLKADIDRIPGHRNI